MTKNQLHRKATFCYGAIFLLSGGCASLNRVEAKLDMTAQHLSASKPDYEGQLRAAKAVGAMTSLQFVDGKQFDVRTAPAGLIPGDIIRIHKLDNEYVAHLWRNAESLPPSPETNALAPLLLSDKK